MTPRAKTPDELRDELLEHMHQLARYWASVPEAKTLLERIEGALFSTLSMLDGCSINITSFDLVARPHPEDKQFHIDRGENWIEEGTAISCSLHEHWHTKET